jgi:AcrR family transcriptional regulator
MSPDAKASAVGGAKRGLAKSKPRRRGRPRQGKAVARDLPRDEEILKIAAEVFYKLGFEGTKLDDIAREAGIVRGSLYHYFGSKEEIYERLVNNVVGTLDIEEEATRHGPPAERLEHILRARLALTLAYPTEVGLIGRQLVRVEGEVGEWARDFRRKHFTAIRQLIVAGQKEGVFRAGDPDILAATTLGLLVQVCEWYRPGGRVGAEALIEEMVEFVMGGLRRPPDER